MATDDVLLQDVEIPAIISMMGTPEKTIEDMLANKFQDDVVDDLDSTLVEAVSVKDDPNNLAKIQHRIRTVITLLQIFLTATLSTNQQS